MCDFLTTHAKVFYPDDVTSPMTVVELTGISAHIPNSRLPKVWVCISQLAHRLNLSYFVQKNALDYDFPDFALHHVANQDYLWQSSCLECFFSASGDNYIEINAKPNGAYAMYEFASYRQPNCLPPPYATGYRLVWQCTNIALPNVAQRHLSIGSCPAVKLCQTDKATIDIQAINKIQPCVILYHDQAPIYYAVNHAQPADFHDKHYWLDI